MAGLTLFLMLHNTPFLFIGFRIFPVSRNWITGLTSLCWALVFLKYSGIWDCTEEYFSIAWSLPSPHPTLHSKEISPVFCLERVSEYFLLFYRWRSETQSLRTSQPLVTATYAKDQMDGKLSGFQSRHLSTSRSCPSTENYTLIKRHCKTQEYIKKPGL